MKVVIADDHPAITMFTTELVSRRLSGGDHIEVVSSADDLVELLHGEAEVVGVVILDLTMPGRWKRLQLVRQVRTIVPTARVMVYSASDEPLLVAAILAEGVQGFVLKSSPKASLLAGLDATLQGVDYVDPAIELDQAQGHPWLTLTEAERGVFVALANGVDLRTLAAERDRSPKTIEAQKYSALNKLGIKPSEIAPYVTQHGLRYELDAG